MNLSKEDRYASLKGVELCTLIPEWKERTAGHESLGPVYIPIKTEVKKIDYGGGLYKNSSHNRAMPLHRNVKQMSQMKPIYAIQSILIDFYYYLFRLTIAEYLNEKKGFFQRLKMF